MRLKFPTHHRNDETDFVLDFLTDLRWIMGDKKTGLIVLDVGCTGSDLMFELDRRGYNVFGIDVRFYHCKPPKGSLFFHGDITIPNFEKYFEGYKIFCIVALSTIEHVGLGCYGDKKVENGDRVALENLHKILDKDGYLILTIPMKYWQTDSGRGYTPQEFHKLIDGLFKEFHTKIIGGQICTVLTKLV